MEAAFSPVPANNDARQAPLGSQPPFVEMQEDDLGVTVRCMLRLTGLSDTAITLLRQGDADSLLGTVMTAVKTGLEILGHQADVSQSDAARARLEAVAGRLESQIESWDRGLRENREQVLAEIGRMVRDARQAVADGRDAADRNATNLGKALDAVTSAATKLDAATADLQKKAAEAAVKNHEHLRDMHDGALKQVETTLKKLVSADDPASAPALIRGIVEKVTAKMQADTETELKSLESTVTRLLGKDAPMAASVAALAREVAEKDMQRVELAIKDLGEKVLSQQIRHRHDANLKGTEYEDRVGELLGIAVDAYGWTAVPTGTVAGHEHNSKKGDWLVLDEDATPLIAIEARDRRGVSMSRIRGDMQLTASNRDVIAVAYLAASEECLPAGVRQHTRGGRPFYPIGLGDGAFGLISVVDPGDAASAERLATLVWVLDRALKARGRSDDDAGTAERLERAAECVGILSEELKQFRTIKGDISKAQGAMSSVSDRVESLEQRLRLHVEKVEQALGTDAPSR